MMNPMQQQPQDPENTDRAADYDCAAQRNDLQRGIEQRDEHLRSEHNQGCDDLVGSMYGESKGECIDGSCVDTQMRLIEKHAHSCPRCMELLSAEQKVQDLIRKRCGEEAPRELKSRIVQQLRVSYTEVRWQ